MNQRRRMFPDSDPWSRGCRSSYGEGALLNRAWREGSALATDLHLMLRLTFVEQEMKCLKDRLDEQAIAANMMSLGSDEYILTHQIPVSIYQDGDDFVATFFDANISAGGHSRQDAFENLQSLIVDIFEMHVEIGDQPLSPAMKSQRSVLERAICRTSQKNSLATL